MNLDEILSEIFRPHSHKIIEFVINDLLENIVDIVLESIGNYDIAINRDEILEKVIKKLESLK